MAPCIHKVTTEWSEIVCGSKLEYSTVVTATVTHKEVSDRSAHEKHVSRNVVGPRTTSCGWVTRGDYPFTIQAPTRSLHRQDIQVVMAAEIKEAFMRYDSGSALENYLVKSWNVGFRLFIPINCELILILN